MDECKNALRAVAAYVAQNSSAFASSGRMLPAQQLEHRSAIEAFGRDVGALADGPIDSSARGAFQRYLSGLHALGFHPKGSLVSEVAQAFHQALDA